MNKFNNVQSGIINSALHLTNFLKQYSNHSEKILYLLRKFIHPSAGRFHPENKFFQKIFEKNHTLCELILGTLLYKTLIKLNNLKILRLCTE